MSIRLRLALWYSALFALILLLVILFNYAFHTRGHYDDVDRALATSATHAASEAIAAEDAPHIVAGSAGLDIVIRLYDPAGVLREIAPPDAALPMLEPAQLLRPASIAPFDPIAGLAPPMGHADFAAHGGALGVLDAGGQRWRSYVLPLDHNQTRLGYLEAAVSLAPLDASIRSYRLALVAICVGSLTIALLASYVVAGRALRPIAQMVDTAEAISHSRDMSRRITMPPQHDELGHLAATFNAMLASLEEAAHAQQRFVADASHELRAPLTAILGNLELIRRQRDMSPAERTEALAEASREAERLSRLVADLLALARADARIPLKRQTVDLDLVVLEAFGAARQLASGHTLALEPFEPLQVVGDPDRLQQLVLILLDNALKYTPPTGAVRLGLRRAGAGAEIIVQDTGEGIAEADLKRVFERFFRGDPARGRDPGGTGLGLPIAGWIVEQHGGTIQLDSAPGAGTRALVVIPALP